jgi:hypothetical protein
MPFAVDEKATKQMMNWITSRPQEVAPDPLPEGWLGTAGGGLPVKQIPHHEFPRVVYLHPNQPARTVVHRNDRHEVIHEEEVPLEHLTKLISCSAHINGGPKDCVECNASLDAALEEGWLKQPYIPEAPEKSDADLYGPRKKK